MKMFFKRLSIFVALVLSFGTVALFAACDNQGGPTKPVQSLEIVSQPTKTTYEQGETFDPTGLVIDATYEDETVEHDVAYTVETTNALQPSDTRVIVSFGGKRVAIDIRVTYRGNNDRYSVANTDPLANSPLAGKTYLLLGSSVAFGTGSGGEAMGEYLAKRNGCTVIKKAVSGTTLADGKSNSYVRRLEQYIESEDKEETLDAFVCQLSTNDASIPKSLGSVSESTVKDISSFDKATTYGAMEYIIALVKETWDCPIVFFTNSHYEKSAYAEMVEALHEIEAKWGITVIDLYTDEAFNDISASDYELYMTDEIHPTKAGYREWWLPKFEETLKSL